MVPDPLPLRAHTLLCLLGFRGEGYSPAFVARMGAVHAHLRAEPGHPVRLLAAPDAICDACPHLRGGCTLHGAGHEAQMRAQDEDVLARLGLAAGEVRPWSELLGRIRERIAPRDLPAICTTCPWLPLGWCQEGLDALAGGAADPGPAAP